MTKKEMLKEKKQIWKDYKQYYCYGCMCLCCEKFYKELIFIPHTSDDFKDLHICKKCWLGENNET